MITAAMKFDYKQTSTNAENLFEELADVKIMIEQISQAVDGLSEDRINHWIDYKLKRQMTRIENERSAKAEANKTKRYIIYSQKQPSQKHREGKNIRKIKG